MNNFIRLFLVLSFSLLLASCSSSKRPKMAYDQKDKGAVQDIESFNVKASAENFRQTAEQFNQDSNDIMVVKISCEDNKLQIAFYDMGTPVDPKKVKHREIDNIKPGGLGTFFIQEIMDSIKFKEGDKPWINNLVLTKKL